MQAQAAVAVNPLFVRHDLMVEMARIEMQIEDMEEHNVTCADAEIIPLRQRMEKISHVLSQVEM